MHAVNISPSRRLFRIAFLLSLFSIAANILEGLASMCFGARDET